MLSRVEFHPQWFKNPPIELNPSIGLNQSPQNHHLTSLGSNLWKRRYQVPWLVVIGGSFILSSEFENEISDRGLIAGWCPQE
jgi:hypothetical protein